MRRLIAAALLAGAAIPTQATAAPLLFSFFSRDRTQAVMFTIDSTPVVQTNPRLGEFYVKNVPVETYYGINNSDVVFLDRDGRGGFGVDTDNGRTVLFLVGGPILFTGSLSRPSFSPGVFLLEKNGPWAGGLLDISPTVDPDAVPEPATWAMMIAGFGAVGYAMRRRQKVTAKVRFA